MTNAMNATKKIATAVATCSASTSSTPTVAMASATSTMTAQARRFVPMSLPKPRAEARLKLRPTDVGCPKAACEISPTRKSSATSCKKNVSTKSKACALPRSGTKYDTTSTIR